MSRSVLLVLAGMLWSGAAFGQEHGEKKASGHGQEGAPPAEMSAEDAAWMKASMPGEKHKLLDDMVGEWKAEGRMWMDPGAEPETMEGVCTNEWVMGGRFVKTTYTGDGMHGAEKFRGEGFMGYDNIRKKFVSAWVDTMGTGIMYEEGTYDPSTRTFASETEIPTPMGGTIRQRCTTQIVDRDKHVMTFYHTHAPGGEEMKAIEIVYTRTGEVKQDEAQAARAEN